MDPCLAETLVRRECAVQVSRGDDPWSLLAHIGSLSPRYDDEADQWLVMDERLASVYSSVLAENFAIANQLQPTTDQIGAYVVANNWTSERIAAALLDEPDPCAATTSGEMAETLGFLALNLVVPITSTTFRQARSLRSGNATARGSWPSARRSTMQPQT
jgi:hypothetical protein